jgi:UDP-glucose 4-epimerase
MEKNNVKNIIFSSSATVYHQENQMPLIEQNLL